MSLSTHLLTIAPTRRTVAIKASPIQQRDLLIERIGECVMEFGLLYEWQVPADADRATEARILSDAVEQCRLAEEYGFTSVWSVEHHFLEGFSHASAPEVLLSFIAAATSTIRIGHGVRLLPFPYNHPVRAAEMAATLDLLSGGRLEFGSGRSATKPELGGFNIDPADTRGMWEESLRLIVDAWTQPTICHDGEYFNVPERPVVPKPFQQPHPPLWMSCTSPETHELAGNFGLGLLSFTLAINPDEVGRRIELYRKACKTAKPIGKEVNEQVAVFTMTHCAETDAKARLHAESGVMRYQHDQIELLTTMIADATPGSSYEYYERYVGVDYDKFNYEYLDANDMIMVGDPAHCRRVAQRYADMGVDRLLCHVQFKDMTQEQICDNIRLLGTEVVPHFR
jgi:alkanesulfonate monooxygenase SsuD/methylene tetrahydromethanopterin reductase-like flavin-dependent oxidoreductase (luciferase family)